MHIRIVSILLQENAELVRKFAPILACTQIATFLLKAVRAEDIHGRTALHYAIRRISQVSLTLEEVSSIDWNQFQENERLTMGALGSIANQDGGAAREGEEEVVQILLYNGADLYDLDEVRNIEYFLRLITHSSWA